jgi:hypothetical protein
MRSVSGSEPTAADALQHANERELRLMWNTRGAADIALLEGRSRGCGRWLNLLARLHGR